MTERNAQIYEEIKKHLVAATALVNKALESLNRDNPDQQQEFDFFELMGGRLEEWM